MLFHKFLKVLDDVFIICLDSPQCFRDRHKDAVENLIPVAHTARDMGGEDLRDFLVKQLNMWMQWSNSMPT